MWFKRRRNEYGCPMCGRLPVIKAWQTEKYHESRKVRTTLTVYRLQCPRGHISTSWFSHAALASSGKNSWTSTRGRIRNERVSVLSNPSASAQHGCDRIRCQRDQPPARHRQAARARHRIPPAPTRRPSATGYGTANANLTHTLYWTSRPTVANKGLRQQDQTHPKRNQGANT